eukprot:4194519-Pleurochrysis_carterae.AAC.2
MRGRRALTEVMCVAHRPPVRGLGREKRLFKETVTGIQQHTRLPRIMPLCALAGCADEARLGRS